MSSSASSSTADLTRRWALAALLLLSPSIAAAQDDEPWILSGPMVGHTTHEATTIWLQGRGPGSATIRLRPAGEEAWRELHDVASGPRHILKVSVDGLRPRTRYEYQVVPAQGRPPASPETWQLQTLPEPRDASATVRLAFGSCANTRFDPTQDIFRAIAREELDAFLFLGDNTYFSHEDAKDPARMRACYEASRRVPGLQPLLRGTPCYATWDDHDYGPNNADKSFALKGESLSLFKDFWANPSYGSGDAEGVWCRVRVGPAEVFLLDDRFHRDDADAPDGPTKSMWGKAQREWLLASLRESDAPFKLIANGTQVLARYHLFESMQQFTWERDLLISEVMAAKIPGVVFLTGDRHMSEVIRLEGSDERYPLTDITSSPLAVRSWAEGDNLATKRRILFYGATPNYAVLEVSREALTLTYKDPEGRPVGSLRIEAASLRLPDWRGAPRLY